MRKLQALPEKRGIWLWSYDDIKSKTPFQWFATGLLGFLALMFGFALAFVFWDETKESPIAGRLFMEIFPAGIIAFGILHFPAAVIYVYRRRQHQPIDIWECETPNDPALAHRQAQKEDPISAENGSSDQG